MVPPVPTPPIKISSFPSQAFQISGPVVSLCTFGLSGLLNCCSMYPSLPNSVANTSAFPMAPPIPFAAGVSTRSAPNALSKARLSMLIDSGIVRMSLYPLDAATIARPIPVFPEVGSTRIVLPGEISPRASASVIMDSAMRSFTELAGFEDSSLHRTSALQSSPRIFGESLTSGVSPMSSRIESAILMAPAAVDDGFTKERPRDARFVTKASLAARPTRKRVAADKNFMLDGGIQAFLASN
mmetsp:Transcript_5360/g.11278  ORF Transcript_5360/g.11278 Transcript_5360/m.11278 type:complete len:241 (-) Transcript_5360:68-790(-)